jgi:hypothetical protein
VKGCEAGEQQQIMQDDGHEKCPLLQRAGSAHGKKNCLTPKSV